MSLQVRFALLGLLLPCLVAAQQPAPAAATPAADPRVQLASKIPGGAHPEDLHPSVIPGVYEYSHDTDVLYVSADGQYAINGDLYTLADNNNITEARRRDARAKLLAAMPERDMLVFGPKEAKYTVTVFTDVDCAYCRELHNHVAEYNRLGVRVRYLAYPRSGPKTESWTKAEQVWCSADRNAALTAAKRDQPLQTKACPNNPVAGEYALGQKFALTGTPAMVMPNGELVMGYLPPPDLLQHLNGQ
jgi:thiol:disulfide interchange protein DsbC